MDGFKKCLGSEIDRTQGQVENVPEAERYVKDGSLKFMDFCN